MSKQSTYDDCEHDGVFRNINALIVTVNSGKREMTAILPDLTDVTHKASK